MLSKPIVSWDEYFDWVRTLDLSSDLLRERDQPEDDDARPAAEPPAWLEFLLDTGSAVLHAVAREPRDANANAWQP